MGPRGQPPTLTLGIQEMNKSTIFALILLLSISNEAIAAKSFFRVCKVTPNDEYHEPGSIIGLEYPLSTDEVIYFEIRNNEFIVIGGGTNTEENIEVNGGVWSMTLAGDTIKHLKTLKFTLTEVPTNKNELEFKNIPDCEIDYSELKYYESGAWNSKE